jgi:hypothetical protein
MKELGTILIIILIIGSLFEMGILIFAYINADEVECNFLWCKFTRTESFTFTNITSQHICYVNQKEVNCGNITESLLK